MFVAASIVLVVALLLVVAAVAGGGDPAALDLGSFTLDTSASGIFFLGMIASFLLGLSLFMFRTATRRAGARRADRRTVNELTSKLEQFRKDREPENRQQEQ